MHRLFPLLLALLALSGPSFAAQNNYGGWPAARPGPVSSGTGCDGDVCTLTGDATPTSTRSCTEGSGAVTSDMFQLALVNAMDDDSATTGTISNTVGAWTKLVEINTGTAFAVDGVISIWWRWKGANGTTSTWTYEDGNGGDDTAIMRCTTIPFTGVDPTTPFSVTWNGAHAAQELNAGGGPGNPWIGTGCPAVTSGRHGDLNVLAEYVSITGTSGGAPSGYMLNIDGRATSRGHVWASKTLYAPQSVDPGPHTHVGQAVGTDGWCFSIFLRSVGMPTQYRRVHS